MALIKEEVQVPANVVSRTKALVCDICGVESPRSNDWSHSRSDVSEVTIQHRKGYIFPEGGNIETTAVDICPTCFTTKLVPWLTSQGAIPREEESDW